MCLKILPPLTLIFSFLILLIYFITFFFSDFQNILVLSKVSVAILIPFPGCHLACEGKFELYKKYLYFLLQATYPHYLHYVSCLLPCINNQQLKLNKALGNAAVIAVPKSRKNRKQCLGTGSECEGLAVWRCWSDAPPLRQLLHHIHGGKF